MINIVAYKKYFLAVSALLVLTALGASVVLGFKEGIDFTGGTLWQITVAGTNGAPVTTEELQTVFEEKLSIADANIVSTATAGEFLVRFSPIDEKKHQQDLTILANTFPRFSELSFQSIGPSVSAQLKTNALWAIVLVLAGISAYIAFAFRKVSYPVSSWTYGWITLATLLHDVAIPAGMLAILGAYYGVEIDTNFVVALLVIMGFSVHDTIVVFDRVRENLLVTRDKTDFSTVVNTSVNQTVARSVNTSFTLILVLIALLLLGPDHLYYFVLTLLVGVVTGIYSSVFVASPLLLVFRKISTKK
ncbi:MAG: hypothetical protein RIQ54_100 [Candidatus Parcubacteria bacterium]|jgi:preprotein translocase subunit SecF